MIGASVALAGRLATRAAVPAVYGGIRTWAVVAALWYVQPLVRGCARHRRRWLGPYRRPVPTPAGSPGEVAYWSETGRGRTALLAEVLRRSEQLAWGRTVDSGWSDWDLEAEGGPLAKVRVATAEENHGGNRRLVRVRLRLRPTPFGCLLVAAIGLAGVAAGLAAPWAAIPAGVGVLAAAGFMARDARRAAGLAGVFDAAAAALGMTRVGRDGRRESS
jgi:hypothetical protein